MSYNSVLNLKALVGGFYQEKDLVGVFSVIVKTDCETNGSFYSTSRNNPRQISEGCSADWMENSGHHIY